jgi:hypothetical protein
MIKMVLGLVLAVLSLSASTASAYSYKTCLGEKIKFSSNTVTIRPSTVSFPAGYCENGIREAVALFNRNPSKFRWSVSMDSGSVGVGGENEIWGTTDQGLLGGAPARALQNWTCYWFFGNHVHMDSVDIVFDYGSPFQWTASRNKADLIRYGGSGRALHTTALHELGHGLILNHVNTEYNIMGNDFEHLHANGSTATGYIGEDAADGAVFLYGARATAWEDVSVAHWKYLGASGQYSDHTRTVVYSNATGAVLPTTTIDGETGYRVSRGQWVRVEFTYENNGSNTQNGIAAGYFVSTNDLITTLDRRIGGANWNLGRGNVMTTTVTVQIPNDLSLNTNYWLGVVLDETGAVTEAVESNNATYIPIRVQ